MSTNASGFGGEPVEEHGGTVVELGYFDDIHSCLDRTTHALSIETVAGQHLLLAFGRGTAVTTHRRQQEGLAAGLFDAVDDRAGDELDIGDATAAARNGDSRAGGRWPRPDRRLLAGGDFAGHVGERVVGKVLLDRSHLR